MKRTVEMAKAGTPSAKKKGDYDPRPLRGIGKPKRQWMPGPLITTKRGRKAARIKARSAIGQLRGM